jgi:hypothetical protein
MWNLSYTIRAWGMPFLQGRLAERLPHVHDSQSDFPALLRAEPGEEFVQAVLGTVLAAKPDGTTPFEVADHDPIAVMLADGDFVDADDTRGWATSAAELLSHILLVQFLDGMPIKVQLLGYRLDTTLPTTTTDEVGKPLCIKRVVSQPLQSLALHAIALATPDPVNR